MAAAFGVYNDRGYGLAEEIYQECFEIEMVLRGIAFRAKAELRCLYKGREFNRRYIPDLCVFDCLVVELKAVGRSWFGVLGYSSRARVQAMLSLRLGSPLGPG
jgi:GxxExxY protein